MHRMQNMENVQNVQNMEQQLQQHLQTYYEQLTPFERQTCDIAREHLGSSFDLARSNGFLRWLKLRQ